MKRFCYLLSVICCLSSVRAAIPAGYYDTADGKTGDAICAALHDKIKSHTSLGYDNLYSMYQTSDMTSQGYIWDMYSTCDFANPGDKCGSYKKVCDCFNREHSVPASWFNDANPMYCDPFHVVPTDGYVNNQRSNYALGECANGTRLPGGSLCKLGTSTFTGYTGVGKVFEVDDQYKGDFARAYFYMVTCYRDKNFTHASGGATMFTWSNSKAGLTDYTIALMLKWHRQDPVSDKEINRNNAIYARQGNRNPFIDYPCLAEYIWGQYKTEQLDLSSLMSTSDANYASSDHTGCVCTTTDPTLYTPKANASIAVGSASVGESVYQDIYVSGANLTQALSCTLSGTNASLFGLSSSSLQPAAVNVGTTLRVTYTPSATGNHTATLTFTSGELKTSRVVTLTGESKAELVTPVTKTNYAFMAEGIHDTIRQTIRVKSTNLSQGIYLGVSKQGAGIFSVNPTSLSAAQANAGADIVVSYTPTAIGTHSANLIVNSLGSEFTQPTLNLQGTCVFNILSVTDITSSSATLHWVDAGVNQYMVDVFFLSQIVIPEVVQLSDTAGAHASKSGYTTGSGNYIRLGSGSTGGSLTYSGVNLSAGGTVSVVAHAYNSSDQPTMQVYVNDSLCAFPLTTSDATYTVSVPAGTSSSSVIRVVSSAKSQRIMVHTVRAVTGGTKTERTHLSGYPRQENYLFHVLSGLAPDTEYSYTITPQSMSESEIGTFTTDTMSTALPEVINHQSSIIHHPSTKFLSPEGHLLLHHNGHLYNALGTPMN